MDRYHFLELLQKDIKKEDHGGLFSTDFLEELPIGSVRWKLPGAADLAYVRSLLECSQSCPSDSDESYFLFDDDLDSDEVAMVDRRYTEKRKLKKQRQREKKTQEKMKVTASERLNQSSKKDLPSSARSSSAAATEMGHREDEKERNKVKAKEMNVPKKAKVNKKKVSVSWHSEDKENENGVGQDSESQEAQEDTAFRKYLCFTDSANGLSKSNKSQLQEKKVDDGSNDCAATTMEDTDDATILPENYLTFFKKSVKPTCSATKVGNKRSSIKPDVLGSKDNVTEIERNRLVHATGYLTNDDNTELDTEFVTVKKSKKPKHLLESGEHSSDALGVHAYNLILQDSIVQAIDYLNEAINQDPNDIRHYINRSYCYLRQGRYPLALSDARLIVKNSDNPREIARAFCRMGQAFYGMENYEESEKYFEKSINLNPGNHQIQRESLRMQVMKLVHMGFREKAVVQCIERCSKTLVQEWLDQDVITLLANDKDASSNDSVADSDCDDNDIYCSDDDERPSNARLLSKMISNRLKLYNETSSMDSYSQTSVAGSSSNSMPLADKAGTSGIKGAGSTQSGPRVIKAMAPQLLKPPGNACVNDKSIWIGNIPAKTTNVMLRSKFSKFGNVLSVHRGNNDTYAFINFSDCNAVRKVFGNVNNCDINGVKLIIKTAKKSFK